MTKFLNISTDNTLGGNSPSNEVVSSQKALKEYIDANSGGASDGITVNKNSSNQLQAIGLINKNTANGATNPKYDWVGTLQEYQDQTVATSHPDWICYITDDVSGGTSVYTKNQVNNLLNNKQNTLTAGTNITISNDVISAAGASMVDIVNAMYPVGSIFVGVTSTCPLAAITGTWEIVGSGRVLWGADSSHAVGTTIAAGLPDHTHTASYAGAYQGGNGWGGGSCAYAATYSLTTSGASASNSIYGNSSTVQPPAYVVNFWQRTA